MAEATRTPFRQPSADWRDLSARVVNGAALRFTPGPDELRLPSCDDEPVSHNTRQAVAIADCFDSLRQHWRGRPDVFVGSDQFLYWDPAYVPGEKCGNPPVAPDVYVAIGVANRHRSSYVAWEEGKPPDFVLEVVSPSSRRRDEKEKPGIYAKIGVPEFFLYDPEGKLVPTLSGFELRGGAYRLLPRERIREDAVGVRSKKLELFLCVKPAGPEPLDGSLRLYDPAAGQFLPARHELVEGKRQAEAKVEASEARAEASEAKAEASKAKAEASKAKAEASEARAEASEAKVEASEARAEACEAKAEASEARAAASEARVAELEALMEKMRRG